MERLRTVSYTFNVNGDLTEPFLAKKGLRQGDPISPYLFVLKVLKSNGKQSELLFSSKMQKVKFDSCVFRGRPSIILERWLEISFMMPLWVSPLLLLWKRILNKTSIFYGGVPCEVIDAIIEKFQFSVGVPFKYLGIPLTSREPSFIQCQPLIKKILDRIEGWASKLLSYAGRLHLIKSVPFSIQAFRLTGV